MLNGIRLRDIISKIFAYSAKNLLKEFRIDLGSVGVFTIFSVSKQSKNDEVLFDFEGSTDRIISQIFFWLFLFWFNTEE